MFVLFHLEQRIKDCFPLRRRLEKGSGKGALWHANGITKEPTQIRVGIDAHMLAQKVSDIGFAIAELSAQIRVVDAILIASATAAGDLIAPFIKIADKAHCHRGTFGALADKIAMFVTVEGVKECKPDGF